MMPLWRGVALAFLCGAVAAPLGACSMSFPISGFMEDPMVTGSINKPDALLFKALDQEDGRRAKAALATALDPQGNGSKVSWENPASGARGSFEADAEPVPSANTVCRAFRARVEPDGKTDRELRGSACRVSSSDWIVREASEMKRIRG